MGLEGSVLHGSRSSPSMDDQAQVVRAHLWVEQRLFETLGSWVADDPDHEARLMFDVHSQYHGWHAQLFEGRLPVSGPFGVHTGSVDGIDLPAGLFEAVSGAGATILRLSALARVVLPRMVTGYSRHLQRTAPAADEPVARALRLVLRDEIEAWQASEALLEELLARLGPRELEAESARVAEQLGRLEDLLGGCGAGLFRWPGVDRGGRVGGRS